MDLKKLPTHPVTIIGSIALGVAVGLYWPSLAHSLKFIGDIYIDLLKMVILPFLPEPRWYRLPCARRCVMRWRKRCAAMSACS